MMKRIVKTDTDDIVYTLSRSKRVNYMRITINKRGEVRVTAKHTIILRDIDRFVYEKRSWVVKHTRDIANRFCLLPDEGAKTNFSDCRARSLKIIRDRVRHYNSLYDFKVKRINVKNTRAQWGSCSSGGNLSFSYKIFFLPQNLIDYVVVHELVHTIHMNHGVKFYSLLVSILPDYVRCEISLKKYSL